VADAVERRKVGFFGCSVIERDLNMAGNAVECLLWKQEDCMSVRQTLPYILAATLACAVGKVNAAGPLIMGLDG
jgi:hypothetical protein